MVVEEGFPGIMLGVANPTIPLDTQLGSDQQGWAFTGGTGQTHLPHESQRSRAGTALRQLRLEVSRRRVEQVPAVRARRAGGRTSFPEERDGKRDGVL